MDPRPAASAPALPSLPPPPESAPVLQRAASPPPLPQRVAEPPGPPGTAGGPPPAGVEGGEQASGLLLGIPDRASTASAPPDLEISSRSLFAFKAGYSGIFSDIRHDDYYESFYKENSERLKLPPPLPPRAAHDPPPPPAGAGYLHRDDSDASINDLILAETGRHPDQPPYPVGRRDRRDQPEDVGMPSGRPPAHPAPAPLPRPIADGGRPPLEPRYNIARRASPAPEKQHAVDQPALSLDGLPPLPQPRVDPDDGQASLHRSLSAPHPREPAELIDLHSSRPRRYASARDERADPAPRELWQTLTHLSLHEGDSVGATHSPRRAYASGAGAPYSSGLRAPYDAGYAYPQPGSPLEPAPGAIFDTPPPAHWSRAPPDYDAYHDPPIERYAYPAADAALEAGLAYADGARGLYPQQSRAIAGGAQYRGGGGRSNGRARRGNASAGFGFVYGSRGAPGIVVPSAPDYLNAQAAAAAAAAAAAVYKSGGVHINGASFAGGGPGIQPRQLPMLSPIRRAGKSERAGGMHEPYSRRGPKMHSMHSGDARDGYSRGSAYRSLDDPPPSLAVGGGGGSNSSGDAARAKFASFNDIIGRAEELARDQHGCRFLQTKLEEGNAMYVNSIFEECYEKFVDLMTDPFGNYLCQKLFEHCNDSQRLALVERCAPAFPRVSTNMHGTRAVQRMVECLSTPAQVSAVCAALAPAAVALMKDINGNHVIQRCLHRMDPAHNQFVYDAVAAHCFELATHRHGCCVMQRCMDYASPAQRTQLATQINANALPLVQNAFGNYVVQYVLELNDPAYTAEIVRRLRGHLAELSMQKFSSNVVERGLQHGDRRVREELIFELIQDQDVMRRLLHDAYGNYVIQRALQIAESPQLEQICEAIRPHLGSLRQSPYGKKIQAKIQKRMPKGMPASIVSN